MATNESNTGLNIISFLIPLVGWIIYFVDKDEKPILASACAKWAWIGFAVNIVLIILGSIG